MPRCRPSLLAVAFASAATAASAADFVANEMYVASVSHSAISVSSPGKAPHLMIGGTAELDVPVGLAFGPNGHLYAVSGGSDRIVEYAPDGSVVREIGEGSGLVVPRGLAFGASGHLYVTSATAGAVFEFLADGTFIRMLGLNSELVRGEGIAIGPEGHLFVSAQNVDAVLEFDLSGAQVGKWGAASDLDDPIGIAFGPGGDLYVASENTNEVMVFDAGGGFVGSFGAEQGLLLPIGLAFGPDGRLYVTSYFENRITAFALSDPATVVSHEVLTGFDGPTFIAFSPQRIKVLIKGSLASEQVLPTSFSESAILSYSPGARSALLQLVDDPEQDYDLATLLGGELAVFSGSESSIAAGRRLFHGLQVPWKGEERAFASLALDLKTPATPAGTYAVKKGGGRLLANGAQGALSARVTIQKILN